MEWGIIMALPTVIGMLVLIFAQPHDVQYQTFGQTVLNAPEEPIADAVSQEEYRRAA